MVKRILNTVNELNPKEDNDLLIECFDEIWLRSSNVGASRFRVFGRPTRM